LVGHGIPFDLVSLLQTAVGQVPYKDDSQADDGKRKMHYGIAQYKDQVFSAEVDHIMNDLTTFLEKKIVLQIVGDYFIQMENLSELVLHLLALGQQFFLSSSEPPEWRKQFTKNRHLNLMCLVYHPGPLVEGSLFKTTLEHTDATWVTLLAQDKSGGLQLKNQEGTWVNAAPIESGILVNTGNVLFKQSDEFFKAVCHRVIRTETSSRSTRISMPFFYNLKGSNTGGC